jgi:hypothetical protein
LQLIQYIYNGEIIETDEDTGREDGEEEAELATSGEEFRGILVLLWW